MFRFAGKILRIHNFAEKNNLIGDGTIYHYGNTRSQIWGSTMYTTKGCGYQDYLNVVFQPLTANLA